MTDLDSAVLVVPPGHGEGTWHLDVLWNWKIPASVTGGAFSLAEQLLPLGRGSGKWLTALPVERGSWWNGRATSSPASLAPRGASGRPMRTFHRHQSAVPRVCLTPESDGGWPDLQRVEGVNPNCGEWRR